MVQRNVRKVCKRCGGSFITKWTRQVYCCVQGSQRNEEIEKVCVVNQTIRDICLDGEQLLDKSGVYLILNTVNGKYYVGSANVIRVRWEGHKHNLRKDKHCNKYFQNAWNKYGESSFEFKVLEVCEESELSTLEQSYLNTLKPWKRNIGYNICSRVERPPVRCKVKKVKPIVVDSLPRSKGGKRLRYVRVFTGGQTIKVAIYK